MIATVDRMEGGYAVCEKENGSMVRLPLDKLPADVRAGDILVYSEGAYHIDREAAEERRKKIIALQESLWSK